MTREEIINLANASGFHFQTFQAHAPIQHTVESAYSEKCFERFANLILEKAALKAEQGEPVEPVAYLDANYGFMRCGNAADHLPIGTKLYAVPQPAPSVPEWQPIETAPMLKTVLLAVEFDGPGDWRIKCGSFYSNEWHVFGASWNPTHWMPLPRSPEAK